MAFEIREQARDPLTALYALVFFFLALGYATGVLELVTDRGSAPRNAPWSLALAYGGLTAFAQLISVFIAVTALLRDRSVRVTDLIASTGASARAWFIGRTVAAPCIAMTVYSAIPLGIALGSALASGRADVELVGLSAAPERYLRPFAILTMPTMISVIVLIASVVTLFQRIMFAVLAALALIVVWTVALSLVGHESSALRFIGAVADPFANAPVLLETSSWSALQRSTESPHLVGALLANRGAWLLIAAGWAAAAFTRADRAFGADPARSVAGRKTTMASATPSRLSQAGDTTVGAELAVMTREWITRDGGWRILAALGFLNASINATLRAPRGASVVELLMLVAEHSRLFLILLATIYAGELLWRDRDTRMATLIAVTSVSTRALAWARIRGLYAALAVMSAVVAGAGVLALVVAAARGTHMNLIASATVWAAWSTFIVFIPFAQITALSVAMHALVNHKTFAHLLLITGWVGAVILDRQGASEWWYRFAEPAALLGPIDRVNIARDAGAITTIAWLPLAIRAGYWTIVSGALLSVAAFKWPRGDDLKVRLLLGDDEVA